MQSWRRERKSNFVNLALLFPHCPRPAAITFPRRQSAISFFSPDVISTGPEGVITGTAGLDRTVDDAYAAARACALTQLAILQRHLGSLDEIKGIVSVNGYVNAIPGFPDTPKVINGASDLFIELLGESARHVRAAIGVSALSRNALVEFQMTVEI